MKRLNDLTPPELILLQKHIELGKEHVIKILGVRGTQELLQWARPKKEVVDQLGATETEMSGNLILAVNTIITGTFGGWMGLSAIMELNLGSPVIFGAVLSFATLVGAAIGYENFQSTKSEAVKAIQILHFLYLEIDILNKIRQKREQELQEIEADLLAFSSSKTMFSLPDLVLPLERAIKEKLTPYQNHDIYPFLKREIAAIEEEVKRNTENTDSIHPSKEHEPRTLPSFIQRLITTYPREIKSSKPWIRKNIRNIFISLIPTVVGGFGSMFVYLSGSTQIAKAFNSNDLVLFLSSPHAKYAKLATALLFTFYFGFCFLYSNKKAYKRSVEIEKQRDEVVKEEALLTLLDERLFKLRKVREGTQKILQILQFAEENSPSKV